MALKTNKVIEVYFDALDINCKSITGAISDKDKIKLNIKLKECMTCRFYIRNDKSNDFKCYDMGNDGLWYFVKLNELTKGLYWYYFEVDGIKVGKDEFNRAKPYSENLFELLVYENKYGYPEKFIGGIMYQVFPDRFKRVEGYGDKKGKRVRKDWGGTPDYLAVNGKILNDDFFGGNFEGIKSSREYFKSLNVSYVYLNPIFLSRSNHRYDTADYMTIDNLLGTEEDFISLVKDFKTAGISLIFDGVFNHVGDDSIYFNKYGKYSELGAYQSKNSKYYPWFTFQSYPDSYTSWWGIDTLPTINKDSKEFENYIVGEGGVLDKYFAMGLGGVRLDVVDEIPDGFVKRITDKVKSYGNDKIVIGEVWEDATNKIAYDRRREYFQGGELDSVMNYELKDAIINYVISGKAEILYKVVREQINNYPKFSLDCLMNILGTHDTPRVLTVLGKRGRLETRREYMANESLTEEEYESARKMLKVASLLQFTLYGVPCIYYGDEIGMQGNKDPFNRKCFEFEKGDKDIYGWYKFLSELRSANSCFSGGAVSDIKYNGGVFSFVRSDEKTSVTIVVNCFEKATEIELKNEVYEITRDIITDKIVLKTYDFAIFYSI